MFNLTNMNQPHIMVQLSHQRHEAVPMVSCLFIGSDQPNAIKSPELCGTNPPPNGGWSIVGLTWLDQLTTETFSIHDPKGTDHT